MKAVEETELFAVILGVTVLLMSLAGFIVYFIILYRKKQLLHKIEHQSLKLHYEQEILKSQIEVQEQTMQTIGADLHDNIGQLLGLTALTLRSVDLASPVIAASKIQTVDELISKSIAELRQLGKLIQGGQLLKNGIVRAIEYELEWMEKSGSFSLSFINTAQLPIHNPDKDLILFRILQEIFSNIIRHSAASRIIVNLLYENGILVLSAQDNGTGFCKDTINSGSNGMGLANMQRRAAVIGAAVSVNSAPGQGTKVLITIPYP